MSLTLTTWISLALRPHRAPARGIRQLFTLIKALRSRGVAIVYVSHRLTEVVELADRISIMRDGEVVASRRAAEITTGEIVTLIAGRPLGQIFPAKGASCGRTLLE